MNTKKNRLKRLNKKSSCKNKFDAIKISKQKKKIWK